MEIYDELNEKVIYQKKLFETWRALGNKIAMAGAIVQNQIKISEKDIDEWTSYLSKTLSEMTVLADKTLQFITENMLETK